MNETWERLVVPALAAAPAQRRAFIRHQLENGLAGLPAATGLKTGLVVDAACRGELPTDLEALLGMFRALAATNAPDRAEVVPRLWHHAVDLMAKNSYAPHNEAFLARGFPSLVLCADDPI